MISFKGAQFPKDVILFAMFFYVRYTVSYRDLEEIMAERGVNVDHATLNRWVAKGFVARFSVGRRKSLSPFDYAASAANWANGQSPDVNWPFRIMFATSIPSSVAEADPKGVGKTWGSAFMLRCLFRKESRYAYPDYR